MMISDIAVLARRYRSCRDHGSPAATRRATVPDPPRWKHYRLAIASLVLAGAAAPGALASVFYQFDVVGRTGQANVNGDLLKSISTEVSINDLGLVAMIAGTDSGPSVYVGNGSAGPRIISFPTASSTRDFSRGVQINNANKVIARDVISGTQLLRLWDANTPGTFEAVVRGSLSGGTPVFPAPFDAVFSHPAVNNSSGAVFSGLDATFSGTGTVLATPKLLGDNDRLTDFNVLSLETPLRPMIADDGSVIVRAGNVVSAPIMLYKNNLSATTAQLVADSAGGFTALGASPGISDDGTVAAFAGNRGNGPGVFVRLTLNGLNTVFRVAGENAVTPSAELGFDGAASPINFAAIELDQRVGVVRVQLGEDGMHDDVLYVTFVGTPSSASRDNPAIPGTQPLLFSAGKGVWTVRVDLDTELSSGVDATFHLNSPLPVAQVGDRIASPAGACVITDLSVYDPVAAAARDDAGAIRTQRRGDHRVAFHAACADGGAMVVRASHLDSDQDGLLDHWEHAGGGIDIDQDGTVDLALHAFGATTDVRDIFLEIDWSSDRLTGSLQPYRLEPHAGSTKFVADMFAKAPALTGKRYGTRSDGAAPADIPATITAHIDAGNGKDKLDAAFSQNIPAGAPVLQGGNLLTLGGEHLDMVYFGSAPVSVTGVRTRSLQNIKDVHFGGADKSARELAFHYAVMADFYQLLGDNNGNGLVSGGEGNNAAPLIGTVAGATANTLNASSAVFDTTSGLRGHAVMITQGTGSGQVRQIKGNTAHTLTVSANWATRPDATSRFVLFSGSSGRGEVEFRPDHSARPGNDHVVTLGAFTVTVGPPSYPGNATEYGNTFAHELGHTLGLRHGGSDHKTAPSAADPLAKPDYRSLMNYLYQMKELPRDYSRSGDEVFVDWDNLRLDFFSSLHFLGNSYLQGASGTTLDDDPQVELNELEVEDAQGPRDRTLPSVAISSPAASSKLAIGSTLVVDVTASDTSGIDGVTVSADLNGDGTSSGIEETQPAEFLGINKYRATFPTVITGPAGLRIIRAVAKDSWQQAGVADITVQATTTSTAISGDVDGDGDVDADDLASVTVARNTPASGPGDPRDLNGDGMIDALDARKLTLLCTRPRCATR